MKLSCLRTRVQDVTKSNMTISCQCKGLPRTKEGETLRRQPESESYVSERNLLFSVYGPSCIIPFLLGMVQKLLYSRKNAVETS